METPITLPSLLVVELGTTDHNQAQGQQIPTGDIEAADVETTSGKRVTLTSTPLNLPEVPIQACAFVDASDLLGEDWKEWFWEEFDQNNFSWGDNNRTFITPERFVNACDSIEWEEHDITEEEAEAWKGRILNLGNIYIDLEN